MKDVNQTAKHFSDYRLVILHEFFVNTPMEIPLFFIWTLQFPRSSIPLEVPCLLQPCHLFGLDYLWDCLVLLVCIHTVLGSHLTQLITVLFASSRAGSSIFKTANIGMLTFLVLFSRHKIDKKSTKNGEFKCAFTQVVLVKNSWNKK